MPFCYKDYEKILEYLLQNGYSLTLDWRSFPQDKAVALRHDVDIIPELCMQLARIEESMDCRSTWFFLESNGLYSIYDSYTRNIIENLISRGHSVQLHLDASNVKNEQQMNDLFDKSAEKWFDLFGVNLECISFHRPGTFGLLPNCVEYRWHEKIRCTYDGDIFFSAEYISDSNRKPISIETIKEKIEKSKKGIQILTHPLWWADEELGIEEVRRRVEQASINRSNRILHENIKLFSKN